jgi:preprotein translocase subunit YajC
MVDFAYAMAQAPNGGGSGAVMTQVLFFAAIFAIFYFLLIRPQQRQKREREATLGAVKRVTGWSRRAACMAPWWG